MISLTDTSTLKPFSIIIVRLLTLCDLSEVGAVFTRKHEIVMSIDKSDLRAVDVCTCNSMLR